MNCNVKNFVLISVTLQIPRALCLVMHECNKNQCVFCNFILGQVTLSPTEWHLLHRSLFEPVVCAHF